MFYFPLLYLIIICISYTCISPLEFVLCSNEAETVKTDPKTFTLNPGYEITHWEPPNYPSENEVSLEKQQECRSSCYKEIVSRNDRTSVWGGCLDVIYHEDPNLIGALFFRLVRAKGSSEEEFCSPGYYCICVYSENKELTRRHSL